MCGLTPPGNTDEAINIIINMNRLIYLQTGQWISQCNTDFWLYPVLIRTCFKWKNPDKVYIFKLSCIRSSDKYKIE